MCCMFTCSLWFVLWQSCLHLMMLLFSEMAPVNTIHRAEALQHQPAAAPGGESRKSCPFYNIYREVFFCWQNFDFTTKLIRAYKNLTFFLEITSFLLWDSDWIGGLMIKLSNKDFCGRLLVWVLKMNKQKNLLLRSAINGRISNFKSWWWWCL